MKSIGLILNILLLLTGCSSDDNTKTTSIPFTEIGKGVLFTPYQNNDVGINLVIGSLTDWNNLISTIDNPDNVSGNFTEIDIDFSEFQIIAVFDKIHITGGWSIDIISITENEDNLTVNIDNLQNGDLTQIVIQPFHIIKIPINDKPIVFE